MDMDIFALASFGLLVIAWVVLPSQKRTASVTARAGVAAAAAD